MVQLVSWLLPVKGFYAQYLQIQVQQQTIFQLTYAYNLCSWLLGARQLAGNLHKFGCIYVKVLNSGAFHNFKKQLLASSYLFICHSLSQHWSSRPPMDGFLWNLYSKIFREISSLTKIINGYFISRLMYIYDISLNSN